MPSNEHPIDIIVSIERASQEESRKVFTFAKLRRNKSSRTFSFDFKEQELKVLSDAPALVGDLHVAYAMKKFDVAEGDVTPEMRMISKQENFANLYVGINPMSSLTCSLCQ